MLAEMYLRKLEISKLKKQLRNHYITCTRENISFNNSNINDVFVYDIFIIFSYITFNNFLFFS